MQTRPMRPSDRLTMFREGETTADRLGVEIKPGDHVIVQGYRFEVVAATFDPLGNNSHLGRGGTGPRYVLRCKWSGLGVDPRCSYDCGFGRSVGIPWTVVVAA